MFSCVNENKTLLASSDLQRNHKVKQAIGPQFQPSVCTKGISELITLSATTISVRFPIPASVVNHIYNDKGNTMSLEALLNGDKSVRWTGALSNVFG